MAGGDYWNDRDAKWARAYAKREGSSAFRNNASLPVTVPDDVTVLERDPSPCFMCGVAGACRHRPWMLGE